MRVTVSDCLSAVEREFGVPRIDLLSHRRLIDHARPRQIVMWLARRVTSHSLPQIGRAMDRDHTTIMHGIQRVEELRRGSDEFRAVSDRLLSGFAEERASKPHKIADDAGLPRGRAAQPGHRPRSTFRLTHEQMAFLKRQAHSNRMTVSGLIRKAVAQYMAATQSLTG